MKYLFLIPLLVLCFLNQDCFNSNGSHTEVYPYKYYYFFKDNQLNLNFYANDPNAHTYWYELNGGGYQEFGGSVSLPYKIGVVPNFVDVQMKDKDGIVNEANFSF